MSAWYKLSSLSLLSILILFTCLLCANTSIAQIDPVSSQLQAANDAINQAFNAILDAEKAGANVTGQLTQITAAQGILAQAENSFRSGDTNTAAVLAENVLPIAQQIINVAQNAKQNAIISVKMTFGLRLLLS